MATARPCGRAALWKVRRTMRKRELVLGLAMLAIGVSGALVYVKYGKREPHGPEWCKKHQIAEKDCPWCDRSLIGKKGQCKTHGVPEALCFRCNKALEAGFKAERDWCGGHGVPESQCKICNPGGTATPGRCGRHGLAEKNCPWCNKDLVAKGGRCQEHSVPEALCVACKPALKAGFETEGDWCERHRTARSQCVACKKKGNE